MLHFDWEVSPDPQTLPSAEERRRKDGARIVVFQRVVSFVAITRSSGHYCLVSPYESRALRGFIFSLPTLLTGWWSPSGVLYTAYALAHNLLGGVDVTERIDFPHAPRGHATDSTFKMMRLGLCVVILAALFLPLLAWLAFNFFK